MMSSSLHFVDTVNLLAAVQERGYMMHEQSENGNTTGMPGRGTRAFTTADNL